VKVRAFGGEIGVILSFWHANGGISVKVRAFGGEIGVILSFWHANGGISVKVRVEKALKYP